MKNFIVYNDSGDILRVGSCQDSDFDLQPGEGELIIEGKVDDDINYKIIDGVITHSPKIPTAEEVQEKIRAKRDALLSQTDWTQMPDSPLTEEEKQNYRIYRQSLRDLPAKYDTININEVTFPILGEI